MRKLPLCMIFLFFLVLISCNKDSRDRSNNESNNNRQPQKGNIAMHGGTPTIRNPVPHTPDDPNTTNDESNDQPLGYFGTTTLDVTNISSGNSYSLDADIDDNQLQRLYFPKGGWVDFSDCELDEYLCGTCADENGNEWEINGE